MNYQWMILLLKQITVIIKLLNEFFPFIIKFRLCLLGGEIKWH